MITLHATTRRLMQRIRICRSAFAERRFVLTCRLILDHVLEPVLVVADDGRIMSASRACSAAFGYTNDELCRMSTRELLGHAEGEALIEGDATLLRKDGTRTPVETMVLGSSAGGRLKSLVIRDITDRKSYEVETSRLMKDLELERQWLRAVLEHAPFAVILFDRTGRMSFNRQTEEMLGMRLSAEGGTAQYIDRIRYPDGRPVRREQLVTTRVLNTGQPVTGVEFLVVRDDGSRLPVLASGAAIRDAEGKVIGGITVLQDITERIRDEEAIRANERLLEGIFQILPVGVWISDKDARIVRGNPAGLRIWGGARYVDPSEFGEYRGWWANTGKRIEPEEWALARALRRGETSIGEIIRIQCFDGTYKTIINSALPLHDGHGKFAGAIAVNEDVTLLKEVEADLQRALASRDRVLGIVAHDLRSPLNVIQLKLQFLTQMSERRDGHMKALRTIQQQVTAMDRLIGDLLDASSIEQGKLLLEFSVVSCAPLIEDVLAAHEALASNACVRLCADVHRDAPDMLADRGRIVQVLNNLMANALKFTPAGGTITVGAGPARPAGTVLWVIDTGVGIEPEFLDHVFDALWQRRPDARGVGLGLAIAKAIVEAHGGRVRVESTPGSGSAFFFTIPGSSGHPVLVTEGSTGTAGHRDDPPAARASAMTVPGQGDSGDHRPT